MQERKSGIYLDTLEQKLEDEFKGKFTLYVTGPSVIWDDMYDDIYDNQTNKRIPGIIFKEEEE